MGNKVESWDRDLGFIKLGGMILEFLDLFLGWNKNEIN